MTSANTLGDTFNSSPFFLVYPAKIVRLDDVCSSPGRYTVSYDSCACRQQRRTGKQTIELLRRDEEWSSTMLLASFRNTSIDIEEKPIALIEYKPGTSFPGTIGLTLDQPGGI
jgi:hypothetical protein